MQYKAALEESGASPGTVRQTVVENMGVGVIAVGDECF
jgi:hypothetical protein